MSGGQVAIEAIGQLVPQGAHVLDLGCGDGALLAWLQQHRGCTGYGVEISDASTFAGDLEFDSLTVMDFVAAIEDEFDIIISMNQQAEIETYGQLIDAVVKLQG